MSDEGERARPQVRHLDDVGEDPVPVELEERDQVEEQDEVVEEGELVQHRREPGLRERPHEQRRGAGQDHLRVGSGERLEDPLAPIEHQPVGRVDEEGGRAEVDHEPRALDPPPVVHEDRGVSELVDERQQVVQPQEDQRCDGRRAVGEREAPGAVDDDERAEPEDRGRRRGDLRPGPEEPAHTAVVEPSHEAVRARPVDRERPDELTGPPSEPRDRMQGALDGRIGVDVGRLEEPAHLQLPGEVGDRLQVEVPRLAEALDHDLLQ